MIATTESPNTLDRIELAEESVLGAIMLGGAHTLLEAQEVLGTWEAFSSGGRRAIAEAMHRCAGANVHIDALTVADALERANQLDYAGGLERLGQLSDVVSTASTVRFHAGIVKDAHQRRGLIQLAKDTIERASKASEDPHQLAVQLSERLLPITVQRMKRGFVVMDEILGEIGQDLLNREQLALAGKSIGIKTYIPELDALLDGGPEPGDLVSIMGVPGSGKTMLALQWAGNASIDGGHSVAIISAEMSRRHVGIRLLQQVGQLRNRPFKEASFSATDLRDYAWARKILSKAPIHIDDSTSPAIEDIASKLRLLKLQDPKLAFVVVDFLQLLEKRSADRRDLQAQVLSDISYGLKDLAKELNLVIASLVQPNVKEIRKRPDQRPEVSDAQGFSGLEQASDAILLIWPKHEVDPNCLGKPVEISLGKFRAGAKGKVDLQWEAEYMRLWSTGRDEVELERRKDLGHPMYAQGDLSRSPSSTAKLWST